MRTLVLLSLTVAACSQGAAGVSSPTDFESQLASINCERAAFCGFIGKSQQSKCESEAKAAATKYPPTYSTQEAVDAKRLDLDTTIAQKCLDALRKMGCTLDRQLAVNRSCEGLYKPKVPVAAACKESAECVDGWCDQGANGSSGCMGTCKANTPTGMACNPNDPHCRTSDYCDDDTRLCTARAAMGAACGFSPRCQRGLFCKGFDPGDPMNGVPEVKGACKGYGAVAEECQVGFFGNTDCAPELFCDDAVTPFKCTQPVAMGGDCSSFTACADPFDCIGLTFDPNTFEVTKKGKCGPYLDIGKTCPDPAMGETGCPLDSVCEAATKMCTLSGQLNAVCSDAGTGGSCGDNRYADGTTRRCTTMVPLDGACTSPPVDMDGFPLGDDPCHDGSCSMNRCALVCT